MVNFKVIENIDRVTPLLDDFIRLYNNPLVTCAEIRKRLGISTNTYIRLFNKALSNGDIEYRRGPNPNKKNGWVKREPRYWSHIRAEDRWQVRYKREYFCSCKSQREAELMVKELRKCDWDKSRVKEIQFDVRGRLYYGND